MTDKQNQLVALSKSFAIETISLFDTLKDRGKSYTIINQLLKSATSIGANIHEANYAASKPDFINKLQIAMKECYETDYWLGIFHESGIITPEEYKPLYDKCCKIRLLLTSSITTAKNNLERNNSRSE